MTMVSEHSNTAGYMNQSKSQQGETGSQGKDKTIETPVMPHLTGSGLLPTPNASTSMYKSKDRVTHRLPKIDFPYFNGDGPREWLREVQKYFQIHNVRDDLRVGIAGMYLRGRADIWFHCFLAGSPNASWSIFTEEICKRFDEASGEGVTEAFLKIKQKNGIGEYQALFEELKSQVMVLLPCAPESFYISIFTSGLKDEIQHMVKMKRPTSLSQAFEFALLQEATIQTISRNSKTQKAVTNPSNDKNSMVELEEESTVKEGTRKPEITPYDEENPEENSAPKEEGQPKLINPIIEFKEESTGVEKKSDPAVCFPGDKVLVPTTNFIPLITTTPGIRNGYEFAAIENMLKDAEFGYEFSSFNAIQRGPSKISQVDTKMQPVVNSIQQWEDKLEPTSAYDFGSTLVPPLLTIGTAPPFPTAPILLICDISEAFHANLNCLYKVNPNNYLVFLFLHPQKIYQYFLPLSSSHLLLNDHFKDLPTFFHFPVILRPPPKPPDYVNHSNLEDKVNLRGMDVMTLISVNFSILFLLSIHVLFESEKGNTLSLTLSINTLAYGSNRVKKLILNLLPSLPPPRNGKRLMKSYGLGGGHQGMEKSTTL